MVRSSVLEQLGVKGADIEAIADRLIKNSSLISQLVEVLKVEKSSKKFAYEKTLRRISEKKPELIYPYFDTYTALLDSENSFLKWGAILTMANLTAVDSKNKFEEIFKLFYKPVRGQDMITAANTIGCSPVIARAKPELAEKIANEILKVEKTNFLYKGEPSPECRNVAIGHAIDAFDQFFDRVASQKKIVNFVERQLGNTRKQVVKKAERFLRNHVKKQKTE